jgi:bifunctional non-homologous end joining protein LigD
VITHPEKILFPEDGITKGDLAAYYEAIAPIMLPHVDGRPVMMERYHRGVGTKGFFQKNVAKGAPAWLERVTVPKKDGAFEAPIVRGTRSLLWMVNQNSISLHVWATRVPNLEYPDLCVFDLDPMQDEPRVLRQVALAVRDFLRDLGLESWIKTSGSKGFHIVVPLDRKSAYGEVWSFGEAVGKRLVDDDPEQLTLEFAKADRGGRIYVDTGRNGFGATFAAPYAVRPLAGAPVSAPCTWEEVERGDVAPRSFHLKNMAERIERVGDVWGSLRAQSLAPAIERLNARN